LLDPAFETFPDGSAFLVKSEVGNASRLLEIIDDVLSGSAAKAEVKDGTPLALLTKTQLEILKLVAMGYTNTSIAKIRRTQQRTVEQRIQDVYVTLGISDLEHINPRVEATRTYIQFAGLPLERNFEID
jgi:DNA-binding NarL/FixJ family response regulator